MLGKLCAGIGLVVVALVVSGAAKGVFGMSQGTSSPSQIPAQINQEFSDVGLNGPGGNGGGYPVPGQGVPGAGYPGAFVVPPAP